LPEGNKTSYFYNSEKKLIKIILNNGGYHLYTYSNNLVLIDRYDSLGTLLFKDTVLLDSQGLVKTIKWYHKVNDTGQFSCYGQMNYYFSNDGYLIKTISPTLTDTCNLYSIYTIINGNKDHCSFLFPCSPESNFEIYYTYYKDSLNSIGWNYHGIYFTGKDDKNPLKSGYTIQYNDTIGGQGIYTYIYNEMGLIEQMNVNNEPWIKFTYY
jgi:hypothetical protein